MILQAVKIRGKEVDISLLGKVNDKEVAEIWGCCKQHVCKIRTRLGIPSIINRKKKKAKKSLSDLIDFLKKEPLNIKVRTIQREFGEGINGYKINQEYVEKIASENNIKISFYKKTLDKKTMHDTKKCSCKNCNYIKRLKSKIYIRTRLVLTVHFARKLVSEYFEKLESANNIDDVFSEMMLKTEPYMFSDGKRKKRKLLEEPIQILIF